MRDRDCRCTERSPYPAASETIIYIFTALL